MAKKEFNYCGKNIEDLKKMSMDEFAKLLPARQRRSLTRGFTDAQKRFLKSLKVKKDNVKTQCRDMVIIPEFVGKTILIHRGNNFDRVLITTEMLGHYLGEFTYNRKKVAHSAPGIGATRSSAAISVK